ncbi:MAG: HEAT repeat domain-containing protein [Elusimicrobiota bacterium]|jgi:HEAT repeat protein
MRTLLLLLICGLGAARSVDAAPRRARPGPAQKAAKATASPETLLPPAQRAEAMLRTMEGLVARQGEADPLEQIALERRLRGFGPEFRALGLPAVVPLASCLGERTRAHKLRAYAAAFLGLIGDPSALAPLRDVAADPKEEAGLRAAALQAAGSLRLDVTARRTLAEKHAYDPASPEPLLREALAVLAETGSDEADLLLRLAKKHGPGPEGLRETAARSAIAALVSSRRPSEGALLELARYYRRSSPLRGEAAAALRARKPRIGDLPADGFDAVCALLLRERGRPALEAARLLGGTGDVRAVRPLLEALKSPDPSLIAEAAEALVRIGDADSAEPLLRLSESVISDKRFAPREKGGDPRPYAVRIQKAADFFATALRSSREPPAAPEAKAPAKEKAAPAPFRYGGWPTTGKPSPLWNGRRLSLELRETPDPTSPARLERPPEGTPLPVVDSAVVMLEPGLLRARRDLRAGFRDLGPDRVLKPSDYESPVLRVNLDLREGQTLEILAYRPDGACFLRSAGRLLLGECLTESAERDFTLVAEPRTRWWLRTRLGGAAGWYPSDDEGVDFTR